MRSRACARWAMGAALALAGCGSVPISGDYDYSKLEGYVPTDTVQQIKTDRLTPAQIKARLGEPDSSVDGDTPAIAYLRCNAVPAEHCFAVVFLVPIPVPAESCTQNQCQLVGVWFDATGHAVQTKSETGTLRQDCHLPVWLRNHGNKECL